VNPLPSDIFALIVPVAIVLLSLTVHEAAHAWTADRLGDPTARLLGRVSLNPIVHIDPIGTVVLPLIAAIGNFPIIGWAKPVPVDTRRLKHPAQGFMIIAAAGPISNLVLALLSGILALAFAAPSGLASSPYLEPGNILYASATINIFLALFNLIPIPPLDGGNVLAGLLPSSFRPAFDSLRPFGFVILYALMFTGIISRLIGPPAFYLRGLLFP
jgi:Zn-dependent protease